MDFGLADGAGGQAAGDIVERAVEQLEAAEGGGVADACDGLDGRVDLELVGFAFLVRDGACVGGLDGEGLDRVEQVGDLGEGGLCGGDDGGGPLAVLDGLLDAFEIGRDALGHDEARGVVLAAVDLQARGEAFEAQLEIRS